MIDPTKEKRKKKDINSNVRFNFESLEKNSTFAPNSNKYLL